MSAVAAHARRNRVVVCSGASDGVRLFVRLEIQDYFIIPSEKLKRG